MNTALTVQPEQPAAGRLSRAIRADYDLQAENWHGRPTRSGFNFSI